MIFSFSNLFEPAKVKLGFIENMIFGHEKRLYGL